MVTKNNPFPTYEPPIPEGVPIVNCQSFLSVSLSNANIIPEGINGEFE